MISPFVSQLFFLMHFRKAPHYTVDEESIQLMKTCLMSNRKCCSSKHTWCPYLWIYQKCYFCDYQRASQPGIQTFIKPKHWLMLKLSDHSQTEQFPNPQPHPQLTWWSFPGSLQSSLPWSGLCSTLWFMLSFHFSWWGSGIWRNIL